MVCTTGNNVKSRTLCPGGNKATPRNNANVKEELCIRKTADSQWIDQLEHNGWMQTHAKVNGPRKTRGELYEGRVAVNGPCSVCRALWHLCSRSTCQVDSCRRGDGRVVSDADGNCTVWVWSVSSNIQRANGCCPLLVLVAAAPRLQSMKTLILVQDCDLPKYTQAADVMAVAATSWLLEIMRLYTTLSVTCS